MLKKLVVFFVVLIVVCFSQIQAFAVTEDGKYQPTTNDINSIYDTSTLYNSLSDEVKQSLKNIGINGVDSQQIS